MMYWVGTSGWQYPHWSGIFYPDDLKREKWFEFYTRHFRTVEVNVTFYRDMKPSTIKKWLSTSPDEQLN